MLTRDDFPGNGATHFEPAMTKVSCPRCQSSDLELIECMTATTVWQVSNGRLNRADGYHHPGDITHVEARCSKCEHHWRLRKIGHIDMCVISLDPKTFEQKN